MLQGVAVDRGHTHWCSPFMMNLVDKFIEFGEMKQSKENYREECH